MFIVYICSFYDLLLLMNYIVPVYFTILFIVVGNDNDLEGGQGSGNDDNSGKLFDDEKEGVAYSWSFYHFTFAMATLFLMMTLTNWYS